jgi:hypothetical protein
VYKIHPDDVLNIANKLVIPFKEFVLSLEKDQFSQLNTMDEIKRGLGVKGKPGKA